MKILQNYKLYHNCEFIPMHDTQTPDFFNNYFRFLIEVDYTYEQKENNNNSFFEQSNNITFEIKFNHIAIFPTIVKRILDNNDEQLKNFINEYPISDHINASKPLYVFIKKEDYLNCLHHQEIIEKIKDHLNQQFNYFRSYLWSMKDRINIDAIKNNPTPNSFAIVLTPTNTGRK